MERVSIQTIENFNRITRYNIQALLDDFVSFIEDEYVSIFNFFSGKTDDPDTAAFDTLRELKKQTKLALDAFANNSAALQNYEYWILLENIEEIKSQLDTTDNLSRWLKSNVSINNGQYVRSVEVDYAAKEGESLEEIEENILSSSEESDWVDTALRNDLREEDYTLDGGYLIKANFKNRDTVIIDVIVDNINTAEKSYGKDIQKSLVFANNDITVLTGISCIKQAAKILSELRKEDNPTFPEDGVDHKNLIGLSTAGVSYPTIFRQMADTFGKDDSFKSFKIIDVVKSSGDNDGAKILFEVETRAGDVLGDSVEL